MKTEQYPNLRQRSRLVCIVAAMAGLLLLAGCIDEHIVWSPDGKQAAVITSEGLYFTDADGHLSGKVMDEAYLVQWLAKDGDMLLVRQRPANGWEEVERLDSTQAGSTEKEADEAWRQMDAEKQEPWQIIERLDTRAKVCLRDRHAEALQAVLPKDKWTSLSEEKVDVTEIMRAHWSGGQFRLGTVVYASLTRVYTLRVSPDGRMLAFTTEPGEQKSSLGRLYVIGLEAGSREHLVSARSSIYPDWSSDGSALYSMEAIGDGPVHEGGDVSIAAIVRRKVGADGLPDEGTREELVGTVFDTYGRVRCLKSGLVLFNAYQFHVPVTSADGPGDRQLFFAYDTKRPATLLRLVPERQEKDMPDLLCAFSVSPDESQVAFAGLKGEVCVLDLASGSVTSLQGTGDDQQGAPTWRADGALTWVKRIDGKDRGPDSHDFEVMVRQDGKDTALSASWPADVVKAVAK